VRQAIHGTAYKVLIGVRHRSEDNIKIDLVDASVVRIGCSGRLH
jgi:hypothetical protein